MFWLGRGIPDPSLLGGKAAGLDRLLRLGFPAPPGFCVTTAAYVHYLEEANLQMRIAELTSRLPASEAREALVDLTRRPFPPDLAAAVSDAAAALAGAASGAAYAVRSSAIGEDARTASYAGQHETFLGVPPADVEGAIRRCWASLWSERAVAYRTRKALGFADALMAVVVQPTLTAEASAVVFTVNPVSRASDEILINAARGPGDAIVSGEITPDTIVLDKDTLAVRQFVPGDRPSNASMRDLGALALRVERAMGAPVDLEAVYVSGRWYLLQSRPITT